MARHLVAIAAALTLLAAPAALADPSGVYVSQSKETKVRFDKCGSSFCGTIAWTKSGDRSLVGRRMIYDVRQTGDNAWEGRLWNYQDGKTYKGKLSIQGDDLKLAGCVLGGMICRNQIWTKE